MQIIIKLIFYLYRENNATCLKAIFTTSCDYFIFLFLLICIFAWLMIFNYFPLKIINDVESLIFCIENVEFKMKKKKSNFYVR